MPLGQKAKGRLGTALGVTGGIVSAVGMFPGAGILGGALSLGGSAMKPPAATKEDIKELFTNDVGTFWGLLHPLVVMSRQPVVIFWPTPCCFKLMTSSVD